MSLPCPHTIAGVGPCPVKRAEVGHLAEHLITDHLVSPSVAIERARKIQSQVDPTVPTEAPMPSKKKKADPDACKMCARLAAKEPGAKCKRHGGPGRSTSYGKNRETATVTTDPIRAAIDALSAEIRKLTEARDALEAIR